MLIFESADLPLDNDWQVWYTATKRETSTASPNFGLMVPDDTLSLTAFLAATNTQAAVTIDGALSVALTAAGGGTGAYFGAFTGTNLTAKLKASYLNKIVYEIVRDASGRVRSARPLKVVEARLPIPG